MEKRLKTLIEASRFLVELSADAVGKEIKKEVLAIQARWQHYIHGFRQEREMDMLRHDYDISWKSHLEWLDQAEALLNSTVRGVTSEIGLRIQQIEVST